jgi:hypothetical protein
VLVVSSRRRAHAGSVHRRRRPEARVLRSKGVQGRSASCRAGHDQQGGQVGQGQEAGQAGLGQGVAAAGQIVVVAAGR